MNIIDLARITHSYRNESVATAGLLVVATSMASMMSCSILVSLSETLARTGTSRKSGM